MTRRPRTVARAVAEVVAAWGTKRVYGLCGGHIQPIWDELSRLGVDIVDTRHEGAAVHMAHAEADLTDGLGVALVTAGPGFTNTVTAMANAAVGRSPVLVIAGRPPRPQEGMGALQDIPQAALAGPLCRRVESVGHQRRALAALAEAAGSALGADGPAGPSYVDFPTDLLREPMQPQHDDHRWRRLPRPEPLAPDPALVAEAVRLLRASRRPLVVAGRVPGLASATTARFLERTRAAYLSGAEARGLVSEEHEAAVPGARARALGETDLLITLGARLNFQLGFGSPAVVSPEAKVLRIGRSLDELVDNRAPDVALRADSALALDALLEAGGVPADPDVAWPADLRATSRDRAKRLRDAMQAAPPGADGRMHPLRLLGAVDEIVGPETVVVADGGDILSFARIALRPRAYLDAGAFGCLGVGVPYAVAAALCRPGPPVVCVTGDGALGFHALELDTAVRRGAPVLVVVANNEGWNIERADQLAAWDGHVVGTELPGCRYDRLAQALGAHGLRVEEPGQLRPALAEALGRLPAVVDVLVTRDAPSPDFRSGLAGVPDLQPLTTWDEAERRLCGP